MPTNKNVPVPSFLYAERSFDVLQNYCEGLKVPTETRFLLNDLHNRFELTGYRFHIQVQQLIVSLEESLNLNNSFSNLETLFSVFTS